MPRGGHFAALEEPQLLAQEIREFFRPLAKGPRMTGADAFDRGRAPLLFGSSAPGKALPISVQGRAGGSRQRLVISGSFTFPRSPWAH
jgi:hypothetical protein